jgi:uncharacterized membrane protein YozB (DUF420 family)
MADKEIIKPATDHQDFFRAVAGMWTYGALLGVIGYASLLTTRHSPVTKT